MSEIRTIDCTLAHVRAIVPRMRAEERAEIIAAGLEPRHIIHEMWRDSVIRRATFVDGELAAIWGCEGLLASPEGRGWLIVTPLVERVPVAFLKEARRGMREMLETRDRIVSSCIVGYDKALRFLALVGFEIGEPYVVAPGVLFHRLKMER